MPINKIIYATVEVETEEPIGKIILFDKYISPSPFFPYFYMGQENQILNYSNWPDLVSYLYDKKIGVFVYTNDNYVYKDNYQVMSFLNNNGDLTLNFEDPNMVKITKALLEDRLVYYLENNNSNVGWNKTITPLNDIILNNKIFLYKDTNYNIKSLSFTESQNKSSIVIRTNINDNVPLTPLIDKRIEFGLHRIQGKKKNESVIYFGLKGKTFSSTDSTNLLGGLRTRSQLSGHLHSHVHNMNNHTHQMQHTHSLNSHTHDMLHSHSYLDSSPPSESQRYSILYGTNFNIPLVSARINRADSTGQMINRIDSLTQLPSVNTDSPNNNFTQNYSENSTVPNINNTSTQNENNSIIHDDIYTNERNFKYGNKNFSETYTIFPYMYAKKYIV